MYISLLDQLNPLNSMKYPRQAFKYIICKSNGVTAMSIIFCSNVYIYVPSVIQAKYLTNRPSGHRMRNQRRNGQT